MVSRSHIAANVWLGFYPHFRLYQFNFFLRLLPLLRELHRRLRPSPLQCHCIVPN
jgi:hypothetical protein